MIARYGIVCVAALSLSGCASDVFTDYNPNTGESVEQYLRRAKEQTNNPSLRDRTVGEYVIGEGGSGRVVSASSPVTIESARATQGVATRNHTPISPTPTPAPIQKYPVAKRVPGKPGLVISPYDPNGRFVDVSNMPPGSAAKDPYSGKPFEVPVQ